MKPGIAIRCALFSAMVAWVAPAAAHHELERAGAEAIPLKNGGTLWMFKDRKMAAEDRFGHAQAFRTGHVFEAMDGRTITATSSESARLRSLIRKGHKGGE